MTPAEIKADLARLALELGFQRFGVARALPPDRTDFIRAWIAEGRHGEMAWLSRGIERRLDPQLVLPGAKSIVTVGLGYRTPPPERSREVAAYARGDDYHRIIEPRLRKMASLLQSLHGASARAYVDTGPIIERDAAARAGIGWIGKSTMLISETLGTWFFLGAIITDLELPPDAPATNRCGRCTRCIAACPTGAITAPYQLDPRLCIAYLSIEHRGPIPEELRPAFGARIFGCDDCLEACPWNRFALASRENAFLPHPLPPLHRLLTLTKDDFDSLFSRSPVRRARWEGFLRNVCIALGNTGDPSVIPALRAAAATAPPPVPEHAAWAIRRILRHPATQPADHRDPPPPPPAPSNPPSPKHPESIPNTPPDHAWE
ncbi:MAG TPA: tRNA epoxyqueuosine(34) reductase QueG [Verrucomicrobiae bacterium]|nr:tRNA epoxyqueuosine(34) reductase QueG [Verrucomicrobiae bacterium]